MNPKKSSSLVAQHTNLSKSRLLLSALDGINIAQTVLGIELNSNSYTIVSTQLPPRLKVQGKGRGWGGILTMILGLSVQAPGFDTCHICDPQHQHFPIPSSFAICPHSQICSSIRKVQEVVVERGGCCGERGGRGARGGVRLNSPLITSNSV